MGVKDETDRLRVARAALAAGPGEAAFLASVVEFAGLRRWDLRYHTHDSRRSAPGFPDLVLCRPPRLVAAELKVGRNPVTAEQAAWLEGLKASGVETYVWRPEDWPQIEAVLR